MITNSHYCMRTFGPGANRRVEGDLAQVEPRPAFDVCVGMDE